MTGPFGLDQLNFKYAPLPGKQAVLVLLVSKEYEDEENGADHEAAPGVGNADDHESVGKEHHYECTNDRCANGALHAAVKAHSTKNDRHDDVHLVSGSGKSSLVN